MSYSASTPPRQRRGGRNRSRHAEGVSQHGSRDQHERQRLHRDTETFQRPKGGPKLTLWQKILATIGLGPKPPLRRADRSGPAVEVKDMQERSTRPSNQRQSEPRAPRPPREPREPREPKAPRPVIQHEVTSARLYVGNLSYDVTEADLSDLFGGIGQVQNAEIVVNRATQRSKGFAFVEMLTMDEAKRAVAELHDKEYMGRKMLVTGAKPADAARPADSDSPVDAYRPADSVRSEQRFPGSRGREPRGFDQRDSDSPAAESGGSDARPPRRESRPASSPVAGDVTTGIIRREQLPAGVVPPAGPVASASAPSPASTPEAPTAPESEEYLDPIGGS